MSVNDRTDLIQLASAEPVIVRKVFGFEPELAGHSFTANMDVWRLIAIEAVEVKAVRTGNALNGGHAVDGATAWPHESVEMKGGAENLSRICRNKVREIRDF